MNKIVLSVAGAVLIFTVAAPKFTPATPSSRSAWQAAEEKAKIFSGTVIKNGDSFVLSDAANKLSFILDDTEKASHYEGKKVKVTGTIDAASNTIHVQTIQEIA